MNNGCDCVNLLHPSGQDTRDPMCVCFTVLDRLIYSYFNGTFKGNTMK